MTLAELIEHGEVSEADRATEKAPSMQVSGGKMEDKTKKSVECGLAGKLRSKVRWNVY